MKKIFLAAAMLSMTAGMANADIVTIDSIVDNFQNVVGGGSVSITNQDNPGTDSVRWGTSTGFGQSGYDWNSTNTAFDATTDVQFSLGTFTHLNKPISAGTAITSVDLAFSVGTFEAPANLSATFTFGHNETSNSTPCGFPSTSVCDDFVTISNAFFNAPIQYNGQSYFFTLLGFSTNGGVTTTNVFQTQENINNDAELYAIITAAPVPDGGATLALLGGALVGLGALRRKLGI